MQLDRTRIAIRERSYGDVLDLALRVSWAHAPALCVTWLLGAAPAILFNVWLFGGWVQEELDSGLTSEQELGVFFLYMFATALMVMMELPWAAMLTTLYLGAALFVERPKPRQIAADALRSLPQMMLFQILLRGLLVPWVVTWPVLYGMWPFLNEIILLERNPLRRSKQNAAITSTFNRNQIVHARNSGEFFGRWLLSLALGAVMTVALWFSSLWAWSAFWDTEPSDWSAAVLFPQLALWTVLGYFTVARFLSYLDLRIRNEGWEIELKMRAEADRLTRQTA